MVFTCGIANAAIKLKTVLNPYTGKFDFIINVAELEASDFTFSIGSSGSLWELDADDNLIPIEGEAVDSLWELDADDNIQPL